MASVDILTLSSSPPRLFRAFNIPSSPALPSPSHLFKKSSVQSWTGTGLAPAADSGITSSTTKSTLATLPSDDLPSAGTSLSLKLGSGEDGIIQLKKTKHTKRGSIEKSDPIQEAGSLAETGKHIASRPECLSIDGTAVKKPRRKKANNGRTDLITGKEKRVPKPRSKTADGTLADGGLRARAARKPRAKKTEGEGQTQLPKSQVTKHSTTTSTKPVKVTSISKKPALVSRHFSTAVELNKSSEDPLNNGLLEAVKRRTCWTPPKPTVGTTCFTTEASDAANDTKDLAGCESSEETDRRLSEFFGNFAYSGVQAPAVGSEPSNSSCTRKRKLIELVTTNISVSNSATAATKTKATKKKARTLTDQATSAYSHNEELSTTPAPLLQYFSYEKTDIADNDGFKVPPKPRSKSPVKRSSKRGNGTAHAPIVLSPGSALKQVGNQDFIFGTSSQLAREESPTFLRDIHAAMQASNEIDDNDPFTDSPQVSTLPPIRAEEKVAMPAKRNLWSAAARDTDGKLLDIQIVDLSNSPALATSHDPSCVDTTSTGLEVPKHDGIWHDIELVMDAAVPETIGNPSPPPKLFRQLEPPILSSSNMRSPGLSSRALCMPQPSDTIPRIRQSSSANNQTMTGCDPDKPDYTSYTTADLAKEIASYRLKPVKNRNQMIALLERCWEGKRRTALGSLKPNAKLHSSSQPRAVSDKLETSSPKRPRGRPRLSTPEPSPKSKARKSEIKATSTTVYSKPSSNMASLKRVLPKDVQKQTKEPIDEISDSDTGLTPSPPRRNRSQIRTPPLPLQISASTTAEESLELAPTSSQTRLFEHITRAVTGAPPSKDPSNPSWHEKILLYDPIILEDLTAWLNTGPLEKAGWDGEVHPGEVKKWCVSKSICCLWKENLRGGVRSRY